MFHDEGAGLFMIPTAEVPLAAMHNGEILSAQDLPRKYAAYTPCFRKEAGAAGKDTRGLIRQHQFEKVELVWYAEPERSFEALEQITRDAERSADLELPYRVVSRSAPATPDLTPLKRTIWRSGFPVPEPTARSVPVPTIPISRRAAAGRSFPPRCRGHPEFVHTLNGSGLAIGRTLLAILENGQRADGSIGVPRRPRAVHEDGPDRAGLTSRRLQFASARTYCEVRGGSAVSTRRLSIVTRVRCGSMDSSETARRSELTKPNVASMLPVRASLSRTAPPRTPAMLSRQPDSKAAAKGRSSQPSARDAARPPKGAWGAAI